jgi:DNA helicase HerA-like ATPase
MAKETAEPQAVAEKIATGDVTKGAALALGVVVLTAPPIPDGRITLPLEMMNRHGLVAGATGTGKTRTLQLMAEQLSAAGVAVVLADIKGDLSGLAVPGTSNDKITERAGQTGITWTPTGFPTEFLALGGLSTGVPVRASMSSFGPTLLSKVLGLNDTQESSLGLVFHYADKAGLPLLDLKDLRSVITFLVSDEGKGDLKGLGGLSSPTAGVILRSLITLSDNGGEVSFGEPEWEPADLIRTAADGRGVISSVELAAIQDKPQLFSTFLMWLLADLFQEVPEIGDMDKQKLVFFFDEAHLLFHGATKAFLDAVTQTVRLIRSKGVGIFFVTQVPSDVPDSVLGQPGSRVQHALRAFTPDDAAALSKAVRTYPKTDDYDLASLLTQMGTGEAVVTLLSEKGAPTPVAWTRPQPPVVSMGPVDATALGQQVAASTLQPKYGQAIDRESAYEKLAARLAPPPAPEAAPAPPAAPAPQAPAKPKPAPKKADDGVIGGILKSAAVTSFARSAGTQLAREFSRTIFGIGKRKR